LADLKRKRFVSRRYRNRRIGEFLKELDLTEGRGTGIPKIMRAIKQNHSPEPRFETDADRTFFAVTVPVHPKAKATRPVADITPQVERLLHACATPMFRTELQMAMGLSDRKHFRTEYLDPTLHAGLMERTIPEKPSSLLQKYQVTAQARLVLGR
jgi:ATP-dependent DNA helicase RecG